MELDLGRYTLVHAGRTVRLEKQPMELLILLAEKRGQLVTRDEIVARLWDKDVFLDTERSINTAIRKIRAALHDNPEHPRVIETVVGKGYRFIAPITVIAAEQGPPTAPLPAPSVLVRPQWKTVIASALLACAAVLGFAAGWKWLRPALPPSPVRSIAVLPLQNLSGDAAEDYLADGMTQALTTDIAMVSGLRVISHTTSSHYRGSNKTLPEIARELRVDAIVEGSVTRRDGRVRVTVQLVEATTDRHLWADTYERSTSDLLALQDEVARAIARQVQSRLSAQTTAPRLHGRDPQAQDAYLKGLHEADTFTREGLEKSVEHFEAAVGKDPGFAEAWAGLGRAYSLLSLFHYGPREATAKADAAARKAIELDDHLSEAHSALGAVLLKQWSFNAAEKELLRSLELDPSNAAAHLSLGYLYAGVLGRFDEGIQEMRRALDLDPLSPSKRNALGAALYWARRYDDALRVFREVPDGDANTERRHRRIAEVYERKGMQQESVEELVRAMQLTGRPALAEAVQRTYRSAGYAAARSAFLTGDIRERVLRAQHEDGSAAELWWLATDYALLSDKDEAFYWLTKAFANRDEALMYVEVEGQFESLQTDPRFATLARQVGLRY